MTFVTVVCDRCPLLERKNLYYNVNRAGKDGEAKGIGVGRS